MRLLTATCAPLGWVLMFTAPMPAVSPPPNSFLNFPPILMSSAEPRALSVGAKWNTWPACRLALEVSLQEALLPDQESMRTRLVHGDLRRSHPPGIFAVEENLRSRGLTADRSRGRKLRQLDHQK